MNEISTVSVDDETMCSPVSKWSKPRPPPVREEPEDPPARRVAFREPVVSEAIPYHPRTPMGPSPPVVPASPFDVTDPTTWVASSDVQWIFIAWVSMYIAFTIHKDLAPPSTISGVAVRSAVCVLILYVLLKLRPV